MIDSLLANSELRLALTIAMGIVIGVVALAILAMMVNLITYAGLIAFLTGTSRPAKGELQSVSALPKDGSASAEDLSCERPEALPENIRPVLVPPGVRLPDNPREYARVSRMADVQDDEKQR